MDALLAWAHMKVPLILEFGTTFFLLFAFDLISVILNKVSFTHGYMTNNHIPKI